jgi:5-methylcytosine-specific restriction endonuclease McrA
MDDIDKKKKNKAYQAAWYAENSVKVKARAALYRKENPEKVKAYYIARDKDKKKASDAAWRARNLDRKKAKDAAYYVANSDKMKLQFKAAYRANIKKRKAYAAAYHKANHKKLVARVTAWRLANPEARALEGHRRRAKVKCGISRSELGTLREKYGKRCAICHVSGRMTIDHVMPLSRGGQHIISNIQFLCRSCNSSKHARPMELFAREKGLLL